MITVVVLGRENENTAKAICRILEKFGGAYFLSGDSIQDYSAITPSFLVFNTDTVNELPDGSNILLLCDGVQNVKISKSCRFDRMIADCARENIAKDGVVTVGMRRQNDVSISSVEADSVHIAVQKLIKTLSGKEILPCEFSVACGADLDKNALLYAFTLLLLTERADTAVLTLRL